MKKTQTELEVLESKMRGIQQCGSPLLVKLSTLECDFQNMTALLAAAGGAREDTVSILRDIRKNVLERSAILKTHGEHIGQLGDVLQQYAAAIQKLIGAELSPLSATPARTGATFNKS